MWLHRSRARGKGGLLLGAVVCSVAALLFGGGAAHQVRITQQGARVEITPAAPADPTTLMVHPVLNAKPVAQLMGRIEAQENGMAFIPAAPLRAGQRYRAFWRSAEGEVVFLDFTSEASPQAAPKVSLTPSATLPANALKFYLHFTEPMEQGVFLDRLRLIDGNGDEDPGPFRETELWSPDGKRLTVWFHPGRQKAGVNLNLDEGPVLHPQARYSLIVAGRWRSSGGVAIGEDQVFQFATGPADHRCPNMTRWQITAPAAGTRQPLRVRFDEGLDPAMLAAALQIRPTDAAEALPGRVEVAASGQEWTFHPEQPWQQGEYELHANPDLEDLAGNSLVKPFEVDATAPQRAAAVTMRRFSLAEGK